MDHINKKGGLTMRKLSFFVLACAVVATCVSLIMVGMRAMQQRSRATVAVVTVTPAPVVVTPVIPAPAAVLEPVAPEVVPAPPAGVWLPETHGNRLPAAQEVVLPIEPSASPAPKPRTQARPKPAAAKAKRDASQEADRAALEDEHAARDRAAAIEADRLAQVSRFEARRSRAADDAEREYWRGVWMPR